MIPRPYHQRQTKLSLIVSRLMGCVNHTPANEPHWAHLRHRARRNKKDCYDNY
jgi:hypothetical protein